MFEGQGQTSNDRGSLEGLMESPEEVFNDAAGKLFRRLRKAFSRLFQGVVPGFALWRSPPRAETTFLNA